MTSPFTPEMRERINEILSDAEVIYPDNAYPLATRALLAAHDTLAERVRELTKHEHPRFAKGCLLHGNFPCPICYTSAP